MKIRRIVTAVLWPAMAALCLTSCGAPEQKADAQTPGTISEGVYLSEDGGFTVRADGERWLADSERSGGESVLYFKDAENVWISFSGTEGITAQMIASFEDSFVGSYIEGLVAYYPDISAVDSRVIDEKLARLDMTMTSDTGGFELYQILYLASDGENGYIVTSTLRKDEVEKIKPLIYEVVESIEFVN